MQKPVMSMGRKQTKGPAILRGKRQKGNKYMCGMPVVLSTMEKRGRGSELLRGGGSRDLKSK